MTKSNKGNLIIALIGILLFAVYSLAIYLFSGLFTLNAIVSFIFAIVAFVCAFALPRIAVRRPDIEAVFFGIPIIAFGIYYFIAEIFVSAVFIRFQVFLPFEIVLFVQVVLLVAFLVISIISFTAQNASAAQSEDRRNQATALNTQVIDIQSLIDSCRSQNANPELAKSLEHLSETVRYSDPFSNGHPAIAEIENRIADKMMQLQAACSNNDTEIAVRLIQELENLYKERSRKILLIK